MTFAFAPYSLFFALPLSLYLFLHALFRVRLGVKRKEVFALGYVFGFAHFFTSLYWIVYSLDLYGDIFLWLKPIALIGIPLILSLFYGFLAIVMHHFVMKYDFLQKIPKDFIFALLFALIFAIFWTITELMRSYLIFLFPWNLVGYTASYSLALMQIAYYIKVYGLSFVLVFLCGTIYTHNFRAIVMVMVVVFVLFLYGEHQLRSQMQNNNTLEVATNIQNEPENRIEIGNNDVSTTDNISKENSCEKQENQILKIVRLRLVQPNHQNLSFGDLNKKYQMLLKTIELSDFQSANLKNIDYILWPESAMQFALHASNGNTVTIPMILSELLSIEELGDIGIITGLDIISPEQDLTYNSMVLIKSIGASEGVRAKIMSDGVTASASKSEYFVSEEGVHSGTKANVNKKVSVEELYQANQAKILYHKRILVPFGEYVPLYSMLKSFLNPIVESDGLSPGPMKQKNINLYKDMDLSDLVIKLAPLICYEGIFSYPFWRENFSNADMILNITNDFWFGDSSGPYQHFAMSRMRAIESGKALVRVANNGISALIDDKGRIVKKVDLNREGSFDFMVIIRSHGIEVRELK